MHEKHNLILQWATVLCGSLHGLTFDNWISLAVVGTGVITMAINWIYKQKNLDMARAESKTQLRKWRKQ